MGAMPTFKTELALFKGSKQFYIALNNSYSTKLAIATKNEDFVIPEFDIACLDDGTGNIGTISSPD